MRTQTLRFKCGKSLVWLDPEWYRRLVGQLKRGKANRTITLARDTLSEQCESCGHDIADMGQVVGRPALADLTDTRRLPEAQVRCLECGQDYDLVIDELEG